MGVNDTKDLAFIRSILVGARTTWGIGLRNDKGAADANAALKDFVNTYPFIAQTHKKRAYDASSDSEEVGRKLMEKFIKYQESLKNKDKKDTEHSKEQDKAEK